MATPKASTKIDLPGILDDVFTVLTDKEKQIITQRFSLDGKPRATLEQIGQEFSVTRERIRQIEKIALNKLHRTAHNTRLKEINQIAEQIIQKPVASLASKTSSVAS